MLIDSLYQLKKHINELPNDVILNISAQFNYIDGIKFVLEKEPDINCNTAYLNAVLRNNLDIIVYLNMNNKDIHFNNDVLLKNAIEIGDLEIVKYLIEHNAKTTNFLTESSKHFNIFKFLIKNNIINL